MREGPVVVGLDGGADGVKVLERAVELVEHQRATGGLDLVVVHVRQRPSLAYLSPASSGGMADTLDELEERARQDANRVLSQHWVTWRFVIRSGEVARELMKEANEQKAAAIVVGGHRHSLLGSVLTQSVDSSLVHNYRGNLLIIREGEDFSGQTEGSEKTEESPAEESKRQDGAA